MAVPVFIAICFLYQAFVFIISVNFNTYLLLIKIVVKINTYTLFFKMCIRDRYKLIAYDVFSNSSAFSFLCQPLHYMSLTKPFMYRYFSHPMFTLIWLLHFIVCHYTYYRTTFTTSGRSVFKCVEAVAMMY